MGKEKKTEMEWNIEKCGGCVWGSDRSGKAFCMFPTCPFYRSGEQEINTMGDQDHKCESCRKKEKCSRNGFVEGCDLYSPQEKSFKKRSCALCGSTFWVEEHHIFGASNRKRSDRDGLTIDLCEQCHRNGRHAVHQDKETAVRIKKIGQTEYEKAFGEGSFLKEYGRNYL